MIKLGKVKGTLKELREKALKAHTNQLSSFLINGHAKKALKMVEKEKGTLSKEIRKQCDNYAKNYLGNIKFAPELYLYSAIQGKFKEGWMPTNFYYEFVIPDIDGIFSEQSEMKPLTKKILDTNKLPDLLYIHNGFFIEPVNYKIIPNDEAYDYLFKNNDAVIFKSNSSAQGKGIQFYSKNEWDMKKVKCESGVFQKIIQQHDFFNNIFPHPGATIRLTTVLDKNGKAQVCGAYLRLGRDNDASVSTHIQSFNAIKIAIDKETGELSHTGYFPNWLSTETHPDTRVPFKGLTIPSFKAACIEVEELHDRFPFVQSIGWDVTINNKGQIEIMEWNTGANSIVFIEAVQGPCFKDLLELATGKALGK